MGSARIEFDGGIGWITGTGVERCSVPGCSMIHEYLCDYPMGKGKTCDAPLCRRHAVLQSHRLQVTLPGLFDEDDEDLEERRVDFCPTHHAMLKMRREDQRR